MGLPRRAGRLATGLCVGLAVAACGATPRQKPAATPADTAAPPKAAATAPILEVPTVAKLKRAKRVTIGRIGATTVHISYGAIADADYASSLAGQKNALVITQFGPRDSTSEFRPNELGSALLERLDERSPQERARLEVVLRRTWKASSQTEWLDVPRSTSKRTHFPIDRVFVLPFDWGEKAPVKAKSIESGLRDVLGEAKKTSLDNVIVPALTVDVSDKQRVPFRRLYKGVFEVVAASGYEGNVHVEMYSRWRDATLEEAIAELRDRWEALGRP